MTADEAEKYVQGLLVEAAKIAQEHDCGGFVVLIKEYEGGGSYVGYTANMGARDLRRTVNHILELIERRPRPA